MKRSFSLGCCHAVHWLVPDDADGAQIGVELKNARARSQRQLICIAVLSDRSDTPAVSRLENFDLTPILAISEQVHFLITAKEAFKASTFRSMCSRYKLQGQKAGSPPKVHIHQRLSEALAMYPIDIDLEPFLKLGVDEDVFTQLQVDSCGPLLNRRKRDRSRLQAP